MASNEPQSAHLMDVALAGAVPMWLLELAPKGEDYWMRRKGICAQVVAEKGDVLMYGSKKPGAAGEVFNRLAEGLALLLLITKGPVPFGKRVYYPDGGQKSFDTEADANAEVWPSKQALSDMQNDSYGALQSEEMSTVCEETSQATAKHVDATAAGLSEKIGGNDDTK